MRPTFIEIEINFKARRLIKFIGYENKIIISTSVVSQGHSMLLDATFDYMHATVRFVIDLYCTLGKPSK